MNAPSGLMPGPGPRYTLGSHAAFDPLDLVTQQLASPRDDSYQLALQWSGELHTDITASISWAGKGRP